MGRRQSAEEKREYNRERYRKNRDKILAQQKERYEIQKEAISEKGKEYYQLNKEKIKARAAAYYQENTEHVIQRERQRRLDRKLYAMNLLGGKCRDCEMDHPAALDFHHRDPELKSFSISDVCTSRKMVPDDVFEAEIMKCDLICKNHHSIMHHHLDEWDSRED